MKNASLLLMVGLGTAIVLLETNRRARRARLREIEQRLELGRWESEGGAAQSNAPDPDQVLPGQSVSSSTWI